MPQPLNRVNPNATFRISANAPKKYPELAAMACSVLAAWAGIEKELEMLLIRTLRGDQAPALAIYSVLTSQAIQRLALDRAAKSVLNKDQYEVFSAVIGVVDIAYKERNKFAHWLWAESPELPDAMLLVDPEAALRKDIETLQMFRPNPGLVFFPHDFSELPDQSAVYVYTRDDIARSEEIMGEAAQAIANYAEYIDPATVARAIEIRSRLRDVPPSYEEIVAQSLRQLSTIRLYRESLDRVREGQKSNPRPLT